jgi:hypothetical protein
MGYQMVPCEWDMYNSMECALHRNFHGGILMQSKPRDLLTGR